MYRAVTCVAALVLFMFPGASIAGECQEVSSRISDPEYLGACTYEGMEYEFCTTAKVKGTINGTWYYYGPYGNGVNIVPEPPLTGYLGLSAGWALDVLATNRGEIWTQNAWVFHWETLTTDGGYPFGAMLYVVGGTGAYEEATGWLGIIAADYSSWRGYIHGELCTP